MQSAIVSGAYEVSRSIASGGGDFIRSRLSYNEIRNRRRESRREAAEIDPLIAHEEMEFVDGKEHR